MPWCPKCKEEYKIGVSTCPDCNIALVESLDDLKKTTDFVPVFTFETQDLAEKFASYLSYAGIMALSSENEDETVTISVRENEIKKAKKYFAAFYSVEASNALEKEFAEMKETSDLLENREELFSNNENPENAPTRDQELSDAIDEVVHAPEPYERRIEKASEALYTSITFAIFGCVGLIAVLLGILNIIPFFNNFVTALLGIIIFVSLLVVSYFSFKRRKQYLEEAEQEEQLTEALTSWLQANFTKDIVNDIQKQCEENNLSDEITYFKIIGKMKQMIIQQFGNIDDSYLDYLSDEYYNKYIALDEEVNIIDTVDED